ncbi:MAG: DUF1778 domain-containing protein [Planctomycetota bacterium]|jgi:uncharacterized protein (DUF1778 family)|nr:DUF1778 domain-containing protein [Planctomycetota bacterium]
MEQKTANKTAKTKLTRIDARIPVHVRNNIERAASIQGSSKTDFIVSALNTVATQVINDNALLELSVRDQKMLANVLDESEKPHPPLSKMSRLRRAVPEYIKRVKRK